MLLYSTIERLLSVLELENPDSTAGRVTVEVSTNVTKATVGMKAKLVQKRTVESAFESTPVDNTENTNKRRKSGIINKVVTNSSSSTITTSKTTNTIHSNNIPNALNNNSNNNANKTSLKMIPSTKFYPIIQQLFSYFWKLEFEEIDINAAFFAWITSVNCKEYGLTNYGFEASSLPVIKVSMYIIIYICTYP